MADTRKDKRAPISLKVRFKSATLDEFMEQYSHDISRGGIFIKSKSPMSIGTLLKFEFQLKDESRLIHGVGRVVWKRDDGGDDDPPGMGIKFIKMDPESRGLVEKMVAQRGDAPGRFDEGESGSSSSGGGSFFPSTSSESDLPPPEDRTQVRHASEFLATALSEGAAGSASEEAEAKAEEARKRTEEIEKERAAATRKRKPRIKKTLVGVGIPVATGEDDSEEAAGPSDAPPAEESKAVSKAAESAESKAAESEAAESQAADESADEAPDAKAAEDEGPDESAESKAAGEPAADEKAEKPGDESPSAEATVDEAAQTLASTEEPAERKEAAKSEPKPADEPKAKESEPAPKAKPKAEAPSERASSERKVAAAAPPPEEEPASRGAMIFFGVVAVALIGGLVWYQTMGPGAQSASTEGTDEVVDPSELDPSDEGDSEDDDALADIEEGLEGDGDEAQDDDSLAAIEGDAADADDEAAEEEAMVTASVDSRPSGATIFVDGQAQGTAPVEVSFPVGREITVSARLEGHAEASQAVTATENQGALRLSLDALPYVIRVQSEPAGVSVRGGGATATTPGELTLPRAPTGPVTLIGTRRGYQRGSTSVSLESFSESDGRMVATANLTLEEAARPAPRPTPRPSAGDDDEPSGSGGGETGGGSGGSGGTGGGESGGGSGGGGSGGGGSGGGGSGGNGGSGTGGSGGGTEAPPDNPFG